MRVFIVDDECVARARLQHLCKQRADLEVVGEAESGASAIQGMLAHHPDLVLLDVELQDMSGFDVLRALRGQANPAAIMVTVHPHYVLRAFDEDAIDYLTKPIDVERFGHAIDRVQRQLHRVPSAVDKIAAEVSAKVCRRLYAGGSVRLLGESARRLYILEAADVDYIEADGNYVLIHRGTDRYISRSTLAHLESVLAANGFLRIERSALINLRRVGYVERAGQGEFVFTLRTGQKLVSSRSHRRAIIRKLRHSS